MIPEQNTPEWEKWRRSKIGASDCPIIMGISPYMTAAQLFDVKLGLSEVEYKEHMKEGHRIEDEAREFFYEKTGVRVKPKVVISENNPLFIASLDGVSESGSTILEIKYNNKERHEMAKNGKIEDFHNCQCQMQMYVTGLEECHYLSYKPGDEALVVIPRDNEYNAKIYKEGLKFKEMLDNLQQPPLTDRDYVDVSNDVLFCDKVRRYQYYKRLMNEYESKCEDQKDEIIRDSGNRSVRADDFKITRYSVKGRLDYDAILKQYNVDSESYRKPPSINYRITFGYEG